MKKPAPNFYSQSWLYLTVFIAGAAVMVIELLGTRLIAPFYGASLYVWTSVISVTLIALAMGYFIGKRWADRACVTGNRPSGPTNGHFYQHTYSVYAKPAHARHGWALCGQTGHVKSGRHWYKYRLDLRRKYGRQCHRHFVSQVFLFPQVGSREIFIGLGFGLLFLALCVAYFERDRIKLAIALPTVAALLVTSVVLLPFIADSGRHFVNDENYQTRFERESLYGWMRVIENPADNYRLLMIDGSTIGAASISHGENVLAYQEVVTHLLAFAPGMRQALLIVNRTRRRPYGHYT